MFSQMGAVELFISCLVGLLSLGLPVASLVLLWLIYAKLKQIEALLHQDK
jgi:hypothetical protein